MYTGVEGSRSLGLPSCHHRECHGEDDDSIRQNTRDGPPKDTLFSSFSPASHVNWGSEQSHRHRVPVKTTIKTLNRQIRSGHCTVGIDGSHCPGPDLRFLIWLDHMPSVQRVVRVDGQQSHITIVRARGLASAPAALLIRAKSFSVFRFRRRFF